jgi:hypothetical protein
VSGLAGALGFVAQAVSGWLRDTLATLAPASLLRCGALFAFYELCLYLALGLSRNRSQVVEAALAMTQDERLSSQALQAN